MYLNKRIIILLIIIFTSFTNLKDIALLSGAEEKVFFSTYIVDMNGNGDFLTINAAIENCTEGDTIRIWDGTFDESIEVYKRISIIGNGTERTYWTNSYKEDHALILIAVGIQVSGITFKDVKYYAGIQIIYKDIIVNNCRFINCGYGIRMGGDKSILDSCIFERNYFDLTFGSYYNKVNNCTFNWTGGNKDFIGGLYSSETVFRNNTLINCSFPKFFSGNADIDTSNLINGKPFRWFKDKLSFTVPSNSGQVVITNCDKVKINDLNISKVHNAISISNSNNIEIADCVLLNIFDRAIFISGSNNGIQIINNTIEGSSSCYCIDFYDGTTMPIIKNNTISNGSFGVSFQSGDCLEPRFENNIFKNQSFRGVYANDLVGGRFWRNGFINCYHGISGHFFTDTNVQYEEISENYFEGCTIGIWSNYIVFSLENNSFYNIKSKGMEISFEADPPDLTRDILNNHFNKCGIGLDYSNINGKTILGNTFQSCDVGIKMTDTSDNMVRANDFLDNAVNVETTGDDIWHESLPIGGNYWSDYQYKDVKCGTQQYQDGSDGFGDIPYYINSKNLDLYPLFRDVIPPIAEAGFGATFEQGTVFSFNSSGSSDDQMITSYKWEFDYGDEHKAYDYANFDFRFDRSGVFEVTLNVSDFAGHWDTDTIILTVLDSERPIAIADDFFIEQGQVAEFDGSGSTDNEGIVNYTWSFVYDNVDRYLYGAISSFEFDIPGYYDIMLYVKDKRGNIGEITINLTVFDTEDPVANAGPNVEYWAPGEYQLDGTNSRDNGILVSYEWTVTFSEYQSKLSGKTATFFFYAFGNYAIDLVVTDQFGNKDSCRIWIVIKDIEPPVPVIIGNSIMNPGELVTFSGSSSTDNNEIVRYLWKIEGSITYQFEGIELEYAFEKAGKYNITLTIWDRANNNGSVTRPVEVLDIRPPIANAGEDRTVPAGKPIILDGSGSMDDGIITRYTWKFVDDSISRTLSGMIVSYTFTLPGIYEINLFVQDAALYNGEDKVMITVIGTSWLEGTVYGEDRTPLVGARIFVVCDDGVTYSGTTDLFGAFKLEIYYGNFTWTIKASGFKDRVSSGYVDAMGSISLNMSETTLEKEDEASNGITVVVIIIIIIVVLLSIIILALVLFIAYKKTNSKKQGPSGEIIQNALPDGGKDPYQSTENNKDLGAIQNISEDIERIPSPEDRKIDPMNEQLAIPTEGEETDIGGKLPPPILEGEYIRPNK